VRCYDDDDDAISHDPLRMRDGVIARDDTVVLVDVIVLDDMRASGRAEKLPLILLSHSRIASKM
jgi:hypothetical protein